MENNLNRKPLPFRCWKINLTTLFLLFLITGEISAQCLSSVNPVGGTNNLLVLEKKSLRIISFYKYGQGDQYFEGTRHSSFNLIDKAYYNYLSTTFGYGITNKFTFEVETGYFFNKTQVYNLEPKYRLTGHGLSNMVFLGKHSFYSEPVKRIFITGAAGVKVPLSGNPQIVNNIELPVEVQPTIGSYGLVFSASFVKENSGTGMRYFFISRMETNAPNKKEYQLGESFFNSFYVSKHLMFPWLKGDWTTILQLRNEIRGYDQFENIRKESSGSVLFFLAPQINYVYRDEWYFSAMLDIPFYQNFNGTQLGAGPGFTFIVSKSFRL
jgi:hypothetical protein